MDETERRGPGCSAAPWMAAIPRWSRWSTAYGAEEAWDKIITVRWVRRPPSGPSRISVDAVDRLAAASKADSWSRARREWPDRLDDLGHAGEIQRRGGLPYGLWLRGPGHLAHLVRPSVAIVGSRAATAYGNGVATDLATDLAERGVTVVSGGAFGIDAAAHRGALAGGGQRSACWPAGRRRLPAGQRAALRAAGPGSPAGLRAARRVPIRPGCGSWLGTG